MTGPTARPSWSDIGAAGLVAAVGSGAPSTVWTVLRHGDVLASSRAAGTLLPGRRRRPSLFGGLVAHGVISAWWTGALGLAARRHRPGPAEAVAAGLAIAALDLGVIGRRYPAIAALAPGPQVADHLAFTGLFVAALRRRTDQRRLPAAGTVGP